MLSTADADETLKRELRAVSEEWRGNWPERGFTMAMDALFLYPDTVLAVAIAPDRSVGGFLQLVPSPASEGYSLASMRRRRDTPNGLMEYLITEAVAWARAHAVTEVSLNFAVFADFMRAEDGATRLTRGVRWALLKVDRLFQLERLHAFNRKFFPHWRRRYFCFERWSDLPLAGLAYLHAESLLTPPGPWVADDGPDGAMTKLAALGLVLLVVATVPAAARTSAATTDWPLFGYDSARHNASPDGRLTAAERLEAAPRCGSSSTARSTPRRSSSAARIVFTTTYGRTEAMDPANGEDPLALHAAGVRVDRRDGADHELDARRLDRPQRRLRGRARRARAQAAPFRREGALDGDADARSDAREARLSSLNVSRGHVIMTTGGYIGDAPPYQGHVVTIAEKTGRILHVWNSLCSDRAAIIRPELVLVERLGDLVAERRRGRPVERRPARRHRQRPVERPHRLGRQRARPLAGCEAASLATGRRPTRRS